MENALTDVNELNIFLYFLFYKTFQIYYISCFLTTYESNVLLGNTCLQTYNHEI